MQDASDKFVVNAEKEEGLFVQEKIMTPTRNKFVLRKLESGFSKDWCETRCICEKLLQKSTGPLGRLENLLRTKRNKAILCVGLHT